MKIYIIFLTILFIACTDECKKIDPNPDTTLGWMPFQVDNYWYYKCNPGCGSDYSPYIKYTIYNIFDVPDTDSLEFSMVTYGHYSVYDGHILAKSKDGMRLYRANDIGYLMGLINLQNDYRSFINEFYLTANFNLAEGQEFNTGGDPSWNISVVYKTNDEIEFSSGARYRKGLGKINYGEFSYDEIRINGIIYNLNCK